jgi:hypothetical protein
MQQRLFELDGYEFSSPFVGQDMQETPFPFYDEFVVACSYMQNANFVRHILSILKRLVFADLQCEAAH